MCWNCGQRFFGWLERGSGSLAARRNPSSLSWYGKYKNAQDSLSMSNKRYILLPTIGQVTLDKLITHIWGYNSCHCLVFYFGSNRQEEKSFFELPMGDFPAPKREDKLSLNIGTPLQKSFSSYLFGPPFRDYGLVEKSYLKEADWCWCSPTVRLRTEIIIIYLVSWFLIRMVGSVGKAFVYVLMKNHASSFHHMFNEPEHHMLINGSWPHYTF